MTKRRPTEAQMRDRQRRAEAIEAEREAAGSYRVRAFKPPGWKGMEAKALNDKVKPRINREGQDDDQ